MVIIMRIKISEESKSLLRKAGWYEGRRVDVSGIKSLLETHGFVVSQVANDFLSEFHGLRVHDGEFFVEFNVPDAISWMGEGETPYIEALLKASPCLVGLKGTAYILLTPESQVMILNDQWMGYIILNSIYDGMDFLLEVCRPPGADTIPLNKDQIPPGYRGD
jgi:hypothetical protein